MILNKATEPQQHTDIGYNYAACEIRHYTLKNKRCFKRFFKRCHLRTVFGSTKNHSFKGTSSSLPFNNLKNHVSPLLWNKGSSNVKGFFVEPFSQKGREAPLFWRVYTGVSAGLVPIHSDLNCAFPSSHWNVIFSSDSITWHHSGSMKHQQHLQLSSVCQAWNQSVFICSFVGFLPHSRLWVALRFLWRLWKLMVDCDFYEMNF